MTCGGLLATIVPTISGVAVGVGVWVGTAVVVGVGVDVDVGVGSSAGILVGCEVLVAALVGCVVAWAPGVVGPPQATTDNSIINTRMIGGPFIWIRYRGWCRPNV
jgi:hypothetical protein